MHDTRAHIGLNAHLLTLRESFRGAGINSYIRNLLTHLPAAAPGYRLTAFLSERGLDSVPGLTVCRSRWPTVRPAIRVLWEQFVQPLVLARLRIDLLHAMAFVRPVVAPCPVVVTIYDLSFLRTPQRLRRGSRFYLTHMTRYSAQRAARVIAISESTKSDVSVLCGVPANRIDVVYCAADEEFHPINDRSTLDECRRRRGLPAKMILFMGTLEPRKNVTQLVRAFAQLKREHIPHTLVIGGAKGWGCDEIFATVEALGLQDQVYFAGYVPQDELPLWYNAAEVFVYPSSFEGFGLPVLEALACGTPVVTSNTTALPEVVGDAGLLVDPSNVEALAEALGRVLRDASLRQSLRARGLARAAQFSWTRAARETAQVYARALGTRDC